MYGQAIRVHYKGYDSFRTWPGAICSLAVNVLILVNLVTLTTAFFDNSKQEQKSQSTTFDVFNSEEVKLRDFSTRIYFVPWEPASPNVGEYFAEKAIGSKPLFTEKMAALRPRLRRRLSPSPSGVRYP